MVFDDAIIAKGAIVINSVIGRGAKVGSGAVLDSVILGDAACSLNPRYGQGMTVASLSVERLDASLTDHHRSHGNLDGFSHAFQQSL